MHSADDASYQQARALKLGKRGLPPAHREVVDWLAQCLGASVLDFAFDTTETSAGHRQQIVQVIVERIAEVERIDTPHNRRAVAARFLRYFTDAVPAAGDRTKSKVHPRAGDGSPEIVVGFAPIERVETMVAAGKLDDDAIRQRFASITGIDRVGTRRVVWFDTDANLRAARESGVTDAITNAYVEAMKQHDELGYFGPHSVDITFDTQQNVDENYDGKGWMYYR